MIKNVVCTIRVSNEDETICNIQCVGYVMGSKYCGIFDMVCNPKGSERHRCNECIKSEVKE